MILLSTLSWDTVESWESGNESSDSPQLAFIEIVVTAVLYLHVLHVSNFFMAPDTILGLKSPTTMSFADSTEYEEPLGIRHLPVFCSAISYGPSSTKRRVDISRLSRASPMIMPVLLPPKGTSSQALSPTSHPETQANLHLYVHHPSNLSALRASTWSALYPR